MSQNINITTEAKSQSSFSATTTSQTTTTSSQINTRKESSSVSYNSSMMNNYSQKSLKKRIIDFEMTENDEIDDEFKEIKEYFIMQPIGNYQLYDAVCISRLAELNREYDDTVRNKLYSSVILDQKSKIVQIKEQKISFEESLKADLIEKKMEQNFLSIIDEFACITESFDSEIISKICSNKSSAEELETLRLFIISILDSRDQPMMRNIGNDIELKKKYIRLANILLHFKNAPESTDFKGISLSLKNHLSRVISLRNSLVLSLTSWIRFLIQEVYEYVHKIEGLVVDTSFINTLKIETEQKETIVEKFVEKIVYVEKDQAKYVSF